MTAQRFNLGPTPRVTIAGCEGNLEVRSSPSIEIIIETDGAALDAAPGENTASVGMLQGNCSVRVPEGSQVQIGPVAGQVRVKGILGGVEIQDVGGDCHVRRVGSLSIGRTGGDFKLKRAGGLITLGTIDGDASLRSCDGPVRIESVGGDLAGRALPYGLDVGKVGGDLELTTSIAPQATYRLTANGDVLISVPRDSNVRFVLPATTQLRFDRELQAVSEGEQVVVVAGSPSATVEGSAGGGFRICLDNTGPSDEFDTTLDEDFEAYMYDISAQLDSQLHRLEVRLDDLPDHVRHSVQRKMDSARRHVEAAERRTRQAAERAGRSNHRRSGRPVGGGAPNSEPVSDQERLAVLKMVEDGRLTVAEAQKLLAALEGEA